MKCTVMTRDSQMRNTWTDRMFWHPVQLLQYLWQRNGERICHFPVGVMKSVAMIFIWQYHTHEVSFLSCIAFALDKKNWCCGLSSTYFWWAICWATSTFPFNRRELIPAIQTKHMMIGITDEEGTAFMTWMLPDWTADIKGEDGGEFYVGKIVKMHENKVGREQFLVKWVRYPLSEATWEPFENLSGEETCDYQVILIHKLTMLVYIITQNVL